MSDATGDALRDALARLADGLQPWIDGLGNQDPARARLVKAQNDLNDAAVDIAAGQIEQIVRDSSDLKKIASLSLEIETKGGQIAGQEQNIARICGIAAGALTLVTAVASGNVSSILSAVSDMTKIID